MARDRPPKKFKLFAWEIPIAWRQLSYEKAKFLRSSLGVSSAILLMFVQLGLLGSLDESTTVMHRHLRADLVMLHATTEAMFQVVPFSRRRLYQLLNFDSVESVNPIYMDIGVYRNPEDGLSRTIAVYGVNPVEQPFDFSDIDQKIDDLSLTGSVLFDRKSRPEYGPVVENIEAGKTVRAELNGTRINIAETTNFIGVSFGITGTLITSDTTFSRFFPALGNLENIALGAIHLKPGSDPATVAQSLEGKLPTDIKLLTVPDFIQLEQSYWQLTTPVGFIFKMGVVVGFLIGMYIVYQVLFTDIANHIPDYAVLKAKGYPDAYFYLLVIQEALILSASSYIPGYFFATTIYWIISFGTGLPVFMTHDRALLVLSLTLSMCIIAGLLVTQKLKDSDPADLF
ncbi:MAG: ABC transporter permease DevC [Cyanobacteria bacterium P01_H01_bin.130]